MDDLDLGVVENEDDWPEEEGAEETQEGEEEGHLVDGGLLHSHLQQDLQSCTVCVCVCACV